MEQTDVTMAKGIWEAFFNSSSFMQDDTDEIDEGVEIDGIADDLSKIDHNSGLYNYLRFIYAKD